MTVTAGSDVKKFVKQVGVAKVGVMAMPKWGNGPYAGKLGSTSQTVGITAWTKYPEVAADFIMFMHTPERQAAWFKTTGAFPADDRFNTKLITLPQQKVLFDLVKNGSPYLENFIPPELDAKAFFAQSQLVLGGSTTAPRRPPRPRRSRSGSARRSGSRWRTSRRGQPRTARRWPLDRCRGSSDPRHRRSLTTEETAQVPARPLRAARCGSPLRSRSSSSCSATRWSSSSRRRSSSTAPGRPRTSASRGPTRPSARRSATTPGSCSRCPSSSPRSLLLSILLFEGLRGWRFHRWALFLPYVLAIPVIGVVFGQLLQFNGLVNQLLRAVGLGGLAQDWLGQPRWALWTMTAVIVWRELGFGIILFLARLLSVSSDVFEAGRMDGARFFRLHRRITIPQLSGVIVFYVVVEAITMVSWVFNYVYVMTNGQGGPGDATQVTELYIYQTAFQYQSPEIASAAAATLFAVTLVLIADVLPHPAPVGDRAR